MGVPVNNTLVRHAVFLAADSLLRVLIKSTTERKEKIQAKVSKPMGKVSCF